MTFVLFCIQAFTVVAVALIAALVTVASAGVPAAARYPAGVNPAACPNYPYCNPLVDPKGPGYALGGGAYPAAAYGRGAAWGGWGAGATGYPVGAAVGYAAVSEVFWTT